MCNIKTNRMKRLLLLFSIFCVTSLAQAQNYLCFTANSDNSSVGMQVVSYNDTLSDLSVDVNFSLDGGVTWNAVQAGKVVILKKGDKVYLKGENPDGFSVIDRWNQFVMTGSISASGSVMSLIDGKGESTVIPAQYCFERLFMGCASLTSAPELPATDLKEWCYCDMFNRCANLTSAPELPATKLVNGCYHSMFCRCSSLTEAPALPATQMKSDCYLSMFSNCSSLLKTPELPATTLADRCYYNMFNRCTSLTEAPELSATKMAPYCYAFMFANCSKLAKAPQSLPAMELADYCYRGMFEGCEGLAVAPELPATSLANYCYWEMFSGCSSLSKAPYLPATEVKTWSYYQMFQLCSKLNYMEVALPTWSTVGNNTYGWVKGISKKGAFIRPVSLEGNYGISYIPEGWGAEGGVDDVLNVNDIFSSAGHIFIISSGNGTANIFNLGGQLMKSVSYEEGETDLGAFPAGVYVVNGRKVVVE